MGRECVCSARFSWIDKGASREGKALLEENEVLFRGEPRVKLSRNEITAMVVRGEELVVTHTLGTARFLLGAAESAKWEKRFLSPPSLLDKFGIKQETRVTAMGPVPPVLVDAAAAANIELGKTLRPNTEVVLVAVDSQAKLPRAVASAEKMRGAMRLWVLFPRGSKVLPEALVRAALLATGVVDNKTARVDDTWTSLQFVVRKENR